MSPITAVEEKIMPISQTLLLLALRALGTIYPMLGVEGLTLLKDMWWNTVEQLEILRSILQLLPH